MFACGLTLWVAAALGQASPAEAAWFKAVPAEAEVVLRVRGLEAGRDDLVKMLEAMSPTLAEQAKPALDQGLSQLTEHIGKKAAATPWLALMRLPKPDAVGGDQPPAFVIMVDSNNYDAVIKTVAGDKPAKPKSQPGGYDAIEGDDNKTYYTVKGAGFVAFGTDKDLIAAIARPKSSLDTKLGADLLARLLGGDVGLYVNLAAVQDRYGEQIGKARDKLMAALDQAGGAVGNASMIEAAKGIYGGMFDALKKADALAFHLDFAAEGFTLSGLTTLKPGARSTKPVGAPAAAELVARLPRDAAYYTYMKLAPETMQSLQKMGMSFMFGPGGKPSPEMEKAMELQRQAGTMEVAGCVSMGGGMRGVNLATVGDPRKYDEAMKATMRAMKGNQAEAMNFVKEVKVEEDAQQYKGFRLSKSTATFDLDKFAKLQPNNPAGANALKAMFGGDAMTTWFGTDGKQYLSVVAKSWDDAKSQIDAVLSGRDGIGQTRGYRDVRPKLPQRVSMLFLMSVQGLARQVASQIGAMSGKDDLKVPSDMPKEPALIGGAIANTAAGYEFKAFIPGSVGPVVEKGLIPVFQQLNAVKQ
jgi:hypothetical protein